MTNYNERLDETLYRFAVDTHESKPGQDETPNFDRAKQAITSLIKELVEEAKPTRSETQQGSVTVYGDFGKRDLNIINQFEQNLLKALEAEL